jgi:hypothetical protein
MPAATAWHSDSADDWDPVGRDMGGDDMVIGGWESKPSAGRMRLVEVHKAARRGAPPRAGGGADRAAPQAPPLEPVQKSWRRY